MSNDWYNNTSTVATRLGTARSSDYNAKFTELVTSFALLPDKAPLFEGRVNYAADTGAADAYVVTLGTAPAAYVAGVVVHFKVGAGNTSTGASTINVNSLGTATIQRADGSAIMAGDIVAGAVASVMHDGTNFRLISSAPNMAWLDVGTSQDFDVAGSTVFGYTAAGAAVTGTLGVSGTSTFADITFTGGSMEPAESTGSIADDAVAYVTPPLNTGFFWAWVAPDNANPNSATRFLGYYRVGSVAGGAVVDSGALFNSTIGTGIPTGTTGTDGVVNLFTHTNGRIYVENRLSYASPVHVFWMGA